MHDLALLGVRVDRLDRAALTASLLTAARARECRVYSYLNIHALNIASADPRFRTILNGAAVTYCDGEGVRVGARMLGRHLPPRTVLTYWIWDLCALFQDEGVSVYFLGGKSAVVAAAVELIRKRFPRLRIAGWHHGYFNKSGGESKAVVDEINDAAPDLLFVGFGMPVQEYWIEENRPALRTGAILPSGSMIDYVAGARRSAPPWMADHGLEWLYRFSREPRRLWRRYLIGNPLFLFRVLCQRIRSGRG
jgi:N-acetylglucosaminyldiphosphoundecaprenol N-acetyl-beta-D-mannosaminyltransferase